MRPLRSRTTVALTCVALLTAACGGGGDDAATPDPATGTAPVEAAPGTPTETPSDTADEAPSDTADEAADGTAVAVVDFAFEPADLTVAPGTTVTWTNEGDISHTVTFSDDGPDSGTMAAGDTFEHTFDEPGSYAYVCRFHGQMQGTLEVG